MALHMDKNGKVHIVTPPKTLTQEQIKILENTPVNKELIKEAMSINFNIVNG